METNLNFDWEVGDILYNVTISGDAEAWWVDEIETYEGDSNRNFAISQNEYEAIVNQLNNGNKFIAHVEEEFINHAICMAEALRDEEIERRIDDAMMEKAWREKEGEEWILY